MINLGSWMNGILIGWGVDPKIANTFDEMNHCSIASHTGDRVGLPMQAIFVGSMKKASAAYTLSMGFVASQT